MTSDDVLSDDDIERIEQDNRALLFLDALDAENGRASTRDIRDQHPMTPSEVHYRYEKLADLGLINIDYDNSLTPRGKSAMKIAELTELGQAYVDDELEDDDIEREPTMEEKAEQGYEQAAENREEIESMYGWAADMDARINALTTVFDALGLDEETWEDVVMLHHPEEDLNVDEEQLQEFIREEMAGIDSDDDEDEEGNGSPWIAATADD